MQTEKRGWQAAPAAGWLAAAGVLILSFGAPAVRGNVTNGVPFAESFESHADGFDVAGGGGWASDEAGAGLVTTNPAAINPLTNYTGSLPLAGAHEKVLQIAVHAVSNAVAGGAGHIVLTDLMVLPRRGTREPPADTNLQFGLYFDTNGQAVVWHRNITGNPTNEWRALTNSPSLATGEWARASLAADYVGGLFQVRLNGGAAIADAAGWSGPGGTQPGPWFHMVQTNGAMAGLQFSGSAGLWDYAYLDDLLVTNRSLTWSGGGYVESAANDGSMPTNPPIAIVLSGDTFAGTNGEDFVASGEMQATNLPAGLTARATLTTNSQLAVTLTGNAAAHASANNTSNLTLRLQDTAFALGVAADLTNAAQTNLTVVFTDQPVLTYAPLPAVFYEAMANNGSIENSSPVTIALAGAVFAGTNGSDFVAESRIQVTNLPANLTAAVTRDSTTGLSVRLTGAALNHGGSRTVTNLTFTFRDAAFTGLAATNVAGYRKADLKVQFIDQAQLDYLSAVFVEAPANDGAVTGTAINMLAEQFAGTNGEDFVASGKVTVTNFPPGLTPVVSLQSLSQVVLSFSGKTAAHAAANSVTNFTMAFQNSAFAQSNAAAVLYANRSDLQIEFHNQPQLTYHGAGFSEAATNNGAIDNSTPLTIELAGDAFTGGNGSDLGSYVQVLNLPANLAATFTKDSDTQVSVRLTGTAVNHAAADSKTNLTFTFLTGAFAAADADQVDNHERSDLHVTFHDQPFLTYAGSEFNELYNGTIDNTMPIRIALSGDTFVGAIGDDVVAAGQLQVTHLPPGLSAVATLDSATQLIARLTGAALNHAAADSVTNLTYTFVDGAFAATAGGQVTGYAKADLKINFMDSSPFINTVPYAESFEAYVDGLAIAGTNGWAADFANAGIVTTDPDVVDLLSVYRASGLDFPVATAHTQVLRVSDEISNAIRSGPGALVFTDLMVLPRTRAGHPEGDGSMQFSAYVNADGRLTIWHRNMTGVPTNEWHTLANSPSVPSNRWMRLTFCQDYGRRVFQVAVNQSRPIADPAGWSDDLAHQPGQWFHMVQTNDHMSGVKVTTTPLGSWLDDVSVQLAPPPSWNPKTTVLLFR